MAKVSIPTFKLNNGLEIPALGCGTWLGLNENLEFSTEDAPKLVETMSYAIDIGYRHIDTAHLYRVEPEVGYVVKKKIEEGVVKREDIYITTKVWQHNHRPEDVIKSIKGSLKRMDLDYVDLALLHWPMSITEDGVDEKIDYVDTWRGFESLLELGLAKSIGVSNFNTSQMKRLITEAKVIPAVNQIEVNLNLGEEELVDFCREKNVLIVAYTPYGSLLPSRNRPPATKIDDPVLTNIASKNGKSVTQIVLRYLYQRGIANIPKTLSKSRILENASIFDFELDNEDLANLRKFDINFRTNVPIFWQNYENYPFDKVDGDIPKIPESLLKWKNGVNLDID